MLQLNFYTNQSLSMIVQQHYKPFKPSIFKALLFISFQLLSLSNYPSPMFLLDAINAVGPVLGYVSQLNLIKKQKSLGAFSIDVCAIILLSSIMRIFFWFAKGFALSLLFQSLFLIAVMLILLYECVNLSIVKEERFWRWKKYDSYIKFLLTYSAVLTVTTLIFVSLDIKRYGQIVGFFSLSVQALLGFPQMISNHKTKSVEGLSYAMIGSWVVGDAFKTFYFIWENQPFQFIMCGTVQLIVDFIIIGQIWVYQKQHKAKNFIKGTSVTEGKKDL